MTRPPVLIGRQAVLNRYAELHSAQMPEGVSAHAAAVVCATAGALGAEPCLIEAGNGSGAFLLGRRSTLRPSRRIGQLRLPGVSHRRLEIAARDIVQQSGGQGDAAICAALHDAIQSGWVDAIVLLRIPEASPIAQPDLWQRGTRVLRVPAGPCHLSELEKVDGLINSHLSKKHRGNLRRAQRDLLQAVQGLRLHLFQDDSELDALFEAAESLHARSWQSRIRPGFASNAAERAKVLVRSAADALHTVVLEHDGGPISIAHGYVDGRTWHLESTFFDERFDAYSPGMQVVMAGIDSSRARGVEIVDLGIGDSPYKRRLATSTRPECHITLTRASIRGLVLTAPERGELLLRRLEGTWPKLARSLRRRWRFG